MELQDQESLDKHCESIDFSNSCRQFYMTRLKATEDFKRQVEQSSELRTTNSKKPATKIDNAMETLRKEMASLMDQDVSLMKQLLTLNETIEDIKFRRLHAISNDSLVTSSCNLGNSRLSVNDYDVALPGAENPCSRLTVPTIEVTADNNTKNVKLQSKTIDNYSFIEKEMILDGKTRHIIHGRGNFSLDSGYGEADDYQTDVELTL